MRWLLVILVLPIFCIGQEYLDTVQVDNIQSVPSGNPNLIEPEWSAKNYTQEDKIYNRSVWTFVDNPALAGFDRKLAAAYNFRMRNLAMGVPNKDGNLELAMMKHEVFVDLPFGGPKQNWGMGLYYANEKEFQHTYHTVQMARSLRFRMAKEHYLILGLGIGVQFSKLEDWEKLTFPDMIDPRAGFVYQTHEIKPNTTRIISIIQGGFRYYWKRFSFDYSYHQGPNGLGGLRGTSSILFANRFKTVYHVNVGDGVTVSPEIVLNVTNFNTRINSASILSAYATITYKDLAFGQLGITDLNKLSIRAGYQLKDMLVIQAGVSSYLDRTMAKTAGLASIDVGIRYQIRPWFR